MHVERNMLNSGETPQLKTTTNRLNYSFLSYFNLQRCRFFKLAHLIVIIRELCLSLGLTDLHSGLRQVDFQRHLLPHEDVRVARLGEKRLQNVQLCPSEGGPLSALLPRVGWDKNMKRKK